MSLILRNYLRILFSNTNNDQKIRTLILRILILRTLMNIKNFLIYKTELEEWKNEKTLKNRSIFKLK